MYADITTSTIFMNKTESKNAGKINTTEYNDLKELRSQFPGFRIEIKTTKSKDNMKGLSLTYMKKYIEAHDSKEANLKIFYQLRGMDENGKKVDTMRVASMGEMKMWFLDTYPEVEDMNKTVDDILAKAKKNREAKRQAAKKVA